MYKRLWRSELLLAFLSTLLIATLTWIRLRDLLKRKAAKAGYRFQGCLISESAPYGKTSDKTGSPAILVLAGYEAEPVIPRVPP